MKKWLIYVLILVFVVLIGYFVLFGFNGFKDLGELSGFVNDSKDGVDNGLEGVNDNPSDLGVDGGLDMDSDGGGGSGGGSGEDVGSSDNSNSLPSDVETQPCGTYYDEYGICSGTCEDGECYSEGESCYCKAV